MALRYLAPSGAPIRFADLAPWVAAAARGNAEAALAAAMRRRFDVEHSFHFSTGRAGMTVLLRAMRRLDPERCEVVVPAYTCYSVAASVIKAGLKLRVVDTDPATLDYDTDELQRTPFDRVLAVIATNLYGLPNDLPFLRQLTAERGAFLVDDAAQAMGASIGGRASGTWGDAGLFSFDKGKNVSAIDGGVIVTRVPAIAEAMARTMHEIEAASLTDAAVGAVKALVYFAMLRPALYGIPSRIPQLGLGKTAFTTTFPLTHPPRSLAALAVAMLRRLDEFTAVRTRNAAALHAGLSGVAGLRVMTPRQGTVPAHLRFPVLADDPGVRDELLRALQSHGIGATGSYPGAIADIPDVQPWLADPRPRTAGGRHVAARIVTLPTHPFVTAADVARIVALTRAAVGRAPVRPGASAVRLTH